MLAPNAEMIEQAADSIKSLPEFMADAERKELVSFGDARARAIGATGLSGDFLIGYLLGIQTARQVLAGSVALAIKGVDPKDVL